MPNRKEPLIASMDWLTVIIYMALVGFGWVNIYSAGYNEADSSVLNFSQQYGKQLLWIGLAVILATFTMTIDQRFFESFSYIIYGACLLLLLSVLVIGVEVKGAKSWIDFGFFRLQPAEIAKIGTALALSNWMSRYNFNMKKTRDFAVMATLLLVPMALIIKQNDTGSALTYTSFIVLFYRRGLSPLYLWIIALAGMIFIFVLSYSQVEVQIALLAMMVLAAVFLHAWQELIILASSAVVLIGAWWALNYFEIHEVELSPVLYFIAGGNAVFWLAKSFRNRQLKFLKLSSLLALGAFVFTSSIDKVFKFMEPHQQDRIQALLGLKSDPYGVEYHVIQSLIAIGSGGFSGKGYLQGTQTKYDFVPEQTTDFIFSTIGEEFGFIGTFSVVALFLFLMLRLLFLAERQRSPFSKNYAYCVVGIIFFHFVINIGMVTGVGPVIGVPLPLISYGGSSLWGFTLLLFIFLKMDAQRMDVLGE